MEGCLSSICQVLADLNSEKEYSTSIDVQSFCERKTVAARRQLCKDALAETFCFSTLSNLITWWEEAATS